MSTIAPSSSSIPYAPLITPPAAPTPTEDVALGGKTSSGNGDAFGPAVVVELSAAATDYVFRSNDQDKIIAFHSKGIADYLRSNGSSEEDINKSIKTFEKNYKDSQIKIQEGIAYEKQIKSIQPNLEQTLSDTGGSQSLIDAVRDVTRTASAVGGSGIFEASYAKQETQDQIRKLEGEDALQRSIASGKVYDASSRASAYTNAASLSRYGIDGPAFTVTDTGALKLNSFTLQNVKGGYSLAFDAGTSEFKVARQGVDITAALFAGKAFS